MSVFDSAEWNDLASHKSNVIDGLHLRDLMQDQERCAALVAEHGDIVMDYSRENVTTATMTKLEALAKAADLDEKIAAMKRGDKINQTEGRAVGHMALRAPKVI